MPRVRPWPFFAGGERHQAANPQHQPNFLRACVFPLPLFQPIESAGYHATSLFQPLKVFSDTGASP